MGARASAISCVNILLIGRSLLICSGRGPVELIAIRGFLIPARAITPTARGFDDSRPLLVCAQDAPCSLDAVRAGRFLHGMQYLMKIGTGKGDEGGAAAGEAGPMRTRRDSRVNDGGHGGEKGLAVRLVQAILHGLADQFI